VNDYLKRWPVCIAGIRHLDVERTIGRSSPKVNNTL
jgi:hypothetical protein